MINKNDCIDCDNSIKIYGEWICLIYNKPIPEDGIVEEEECPGFDYIE